MKIICGLGNPGARYTRTRHNVGFHICERLADRWGAILSHTKYNSLIGQTRVSGEAVLLLKPQIFMNRSGNAVGPAMRFHQLLPEDLLIIHDDADLDEGRILIKKGGGTAGHKGLDSIRDNLGSTDFHRLRFGIGRPSDARLELADYVLAALTTAESTLYEEKYELAVNACVSWVKNGVDKTMNDFNGLT